MPELQLNRATIILAVVALALPAISAHGQAAPDRYLVGLPRPHDVATDPRGAAQRHRPRWLRQSAVLAPEGKSLLFTSQRDGQTDIYKLTLESMLIDQLTDTPESSEYSATVVPSGFEFSVIRVEEDGAQRLWAFRRDGSAPSLLLEGVAPVGYQAWTPEHNLVMFVLGEPATLQLADIEGDTAEVIAEDIGRSLHPLPDDSGFSFMQRVDGEFRIRSFDLESGAIGELGAPFEDSQDMAWTPDGRIVMASGSRVAIRTVDGDWQVFADLANAGATRLTRLAVHPDGDQLAVVSVR